jgi:filamentous hemagglutinin family protein
VLQKAYQNFAGLNLEEAATMKTNLLRIFAVSLWIAMIIPAYAQVVLDGSMGAGGKLNGPDYDIKAGYGQQAGANLFHSFQQLNVDTAETATFSGPASVQNIITRVTGGDASWIDGQIRSTIPGADLYLLNPAGLMFGANASLDIGGSFHGSTADYLRLGRNEQFYSMPRQGEVLSTASPAAFGFLPAENGEKNIAPITFEGGQFEQEEWDGNLTGLTVPKGETISLIGGDIQISGAFYQIELDETNVQDVPTGTLQAEEGRINIAAFASEGEVSLTDDGLEISAENAGNIVLDHALISVSGDGAGDVFIRGEQFIADNSKIESDTVDNDGGATDIRANSISLSRTDIFSDAIGTGNGGRINLAGTEAVTISDLSRVFASAWDAGNAGDISIETKNLSVISGGGVYTDTEGTGRGGNITLRAAESVRVSDTKSEIFANALGEDADAGDAGTILIETQKFSLSNKGNISSDTYDGGGEGGHIIISGADGGFAESVEVSDAQILSGTRFGEEPDDGAGGTVEITAETILFTNGGRIGSESDGSGGGGDVILKALKSLQFSGSNDQGTASKAYTSSLNLEEYAGDAGNIFIEAGEVVFKEGGGITASTLGPGNAGVIALKADQLKLDTGASISSASETEGNGGNAGTITIDTENRITLNYGSSITTETVGGGNAGDISLTAGSDIWLNNESSVSSASSSLSDTAGDAGEITVYAGNSLILENNSSFTTEAANAGKGKITIDVAGMHRMQNSKITTSIKRGGNDAGDISLSPPEWTLMNNSKIVANAWEGRGGNIHIAAEHFIRSSASLVDASSALGIDGSVLIESPDVDVSSGLTVLPSNVLDAAGWMRIPCAARSGDTVSSFVIRGRDAVAMALDDWFAASP